MRKTIAYILAALMLFASCSSKPAEENEDKLSEQVINVSPAENETAEEEENDEMAAPELPEFNGETVTFGVVDNANARNAIIMEELTGEALNDAQFQTIINTNEALNINVAEYLLTSGYPSANELIPFITAGDDTIQVANVFCVDALTLMSGAYIRSYDDLENINLDNPWWDAGVNDSLTFAGIRYSAIGDFSISTHDLTYAILFSDKIVTDNSLESPFTLVLEGKWTMDKMAEMMEAVLQDANGNGERDEDDIYGYIGAIKNVLNGFWIGAGEKTMGTDPDTGLPVVTMDSERFLDIITRGFEITYDNGARYINKTADSDVPTECRTMFMRDKGLFFDCSFYWIGALRDMESDYGVIPHPKFEESQDHYYARVSYYMPPVIPATCMNMSLTGAVLEEVNYQSKLLITPAYYEITLKGKFARNPESVEMLDMIFANRVVDLGDTLFASQIRALIIEPMYSGNDRNLSSYLAKNAKPISKIIEKTAKGITDAVNGQ